MPDSAQVAPGGEGNGEGEGEGETEGRPLAEA